MDTDAYLERINYGGTLEPTAETLRRLHVAHLHAVPFENLSIHAGETIVLDDGALFEKVVARRRGGFCYELNGLFAALLRALGFEVTHHLAVVGGEGPVNHMALLVTLDGERWLADAGLGEGFLDPLPLREGSHAIGPLTYTLTREDASTWWMGQHPWGSVSGFRMTEAESVVADFEPHHRRLATDPASSFVRTLVVQQPREDRIVTLRSRTLSRVGPTVDEKHVVADRDEFAATLTDVFGIALRGERLSRLWALAAAQHDAFVASR